MDHPKWSTQGGPLVTVHSSQHKWATLRIHKSWPKLTFNKHADQRGAALDFLLCVSLRDMPSQILEGSNTSQLLSERTPEIDVWSITFARTLQRYFPEPESNLDPKPLTRQQINVVLLSISFFVFLCVICLGAAFLGGAVANGGLVTPPHHALHEATADRP